MLVLLASWIHNTHLIYFCSCVEWFQEVAKLFDLLHSSSEIPYFSVRKCFSQKILMTSLKRIALSSIMNVEFQRVATSATIDSGSPTMHFDISKKEADFWGDCFKKEVN